MSIRTADAVTICDLGFGDGGKGTTVDFLVRQLGIGKIVRLGAPQAAHNVVTPDNVRHCFAQFGSGALVPGVRTFLSSNMLISPDAFLCELKVLEDKGVALVLSRTFFDRESVVITPWHTMAGQILELERGEDRHGSCGMGVGQAIYDSEAGSALTISDMYDSERLRSKLEKIFESKRMIAIDVLGRTDSAMIRSRLDYFVTERTVAKVLAGYRNFTKKICGQVSDLQTFCGGSGGPVIFEGSQGALLDRRYGFYPNITKSVVTHHNATAMLSRLDPNARAHKLGIMRAYGHRHGAGPFPTEDQDLGDKIVDEFNLENEWQGRFRIGWLDLVLMHYGIAANDGIDSLCVTCLDQLRGLSKINVCTSYNYYGDRADVDKYFDVDSSSKQEVHIIRIKKLTENREAVGAILRECLPNYTSFTSREELLDFIESESGLNVPISIISFGPRSDQKIFR